MDDFDFWNEESKWPRDTRDYVFLGRAVDLVGKHLFASDWTGKEGGHRFSRAYADDAQAELRFTEATRRIADACAEGDVESFYRDANGGEIKGPLESSRWNLDDASPLFRRCTIYVYSTRFGTDENRWIFLSRAGLQGLVQTQPTSELLNNLHLSEYMIFMLDMIRELKISPVNQPEVKGLKTHFEKAWRARFNENLSDNHSGVMATFVRDLASKGGKAKKA